jgi:hypothetical protein
MSANDHQEAWIGVAKTGTVHERAVSYLWAENYESKSSNERTIKSRQSGVGDLMC